MAMKDDQKKLISLVADLEIDKATDQVHILLEAGVSPLDVFDLIYKGMNEVGSRYQNDVYGISGLIMAGDIMREIGQILVPQMENNASRNIAVRNNTGRIVLGTVEGDIHFIGKDIFKTLIRSYGFRVHDLGVDVPPANFLSAIHEHKPDIVGFSCLISMAYQAMEETIGFLKKYVPMELRPRAYIIGGRVDRIVFDKIGADHWANDAMEGVRLCEKIMADE